MHHDGHLAIAPFYAPWWSRYIMQLWTIWGKYGRSHLHRGSTGIATALQCVPHCLLLVELLVALRVIHVARGAIQLLVLQQVLSDNDTHLVMTTPQLWLQKTCFLCGTGKYTGTKHCGSSLPTDRCLKDFSPV